MRALVLVAAVAVSAGSLVMGGAGSSAAVSCDANAHYVDAAHDGSSCTSLTSTLTEKWSVKLKGFVSYPLIGAGKVFVTTSIPGARAYGGWLYGLDASDGKVAWGPVRLSGTYWYFPLAYDNGRIFVNDDGGEVTAFDATTGHQLWIYRTMNNTGSEPVARDGVVYVQSSDFVWALSETTGQVLWTSRELDGSGSPLAVDRTGVYLNAGCSRFRLSLLNGDVLWSQNEGCEGGGDGVSWLGDGRFFEQTYGQVLVEKTGKIVGSFSGTPAFAGQNAYLATGTGIFAENVETQTPLFTTMVSGQIREGPVTTNGTVYVATSKKTLYSVSTLDGHITQTLKLPLAPYADYLHRNTPQDLNVGDGLLVVPTGKTLTAFG